MPLCFGKDIHFEKHTEDYSQQVAAAYGSNAVWHLDFREATTLASKEEQVVLTKLREKLGEQKYVTA
ncbi:hypothetical protein WJX82_000400 [Trebouxia sp. C0006]